MFGAGRSGAHSSDHFGFFPVFSAALFVVGDADAPVVDFGVGGGDRRGEVRFDGAEVGTLAGFGVDGVGGRDRDVCSVTV